MKRFGCVHWIFADRIALSLPCVFRNGGKAVSVGRCLRTPGVSLVKERPPRDGRPTATLAFSSLTRKTLK